MKKSKQKQKERKAKKARAARMEANCKRVIETIAPHQESNDQLQSLLAHYLHSIVINEKWMFFKFVQ